MSDTSDTRKVRASSAKEKVELKQAERCFVDRDTDPQAVLDWDVEGKQVFFTEDAPELPQDILEKLSKMTLIKYEQARDIKRRLANDDPEWVEINKSLKISQSGYASPYDIAFGNKAKDGLVSRMVREDRVGYWEAKGYRMATPSTMKDVKMRQVEGHYEHGTIGAPKEYLMVTTEENRDKLMQIREDRRQAIDTAQVENMTKQARDAGLNAFDVK